MLSKASAKIKSKATNIPPAIHETSIAFCLAITEEMMPPAKDATARQINAAVPVTAPGSANEYAPTVNATSKSAVTVKVRAKLLSAGSKAGTDVSCADTCLDLVFCFVILFSSENKTFS